MFLLDEFIELMRVHKVTLMAQCRFGCVAEKLTDLVTNIERHHLTDLVLLCNRPKRWWTIPWSGERFCSSHPPLVGAQLAIPSEQWDSSMLADRQPHGDFLTRAAAAYPADLNRALAVAFMRACDGMKKVPDTVAARFGQLDNRVEMGLPLKKSRVQEKSQEDTNSLRNIHKSVTDRALYIGKQIANLIERRLDESDVEQRIIATKHGGVLQFGTGQHHYIPDTHQGSLSGVLACCD